MAELHRSESGTRSARHIARKQIAKAVEALQNGSSSDKVLLDALNGLVERFHASDDLPPTGELRRMLRRQRAAMRRTALEGPMPFSESCAALQDVLHRADRWHTGSGGWKVLGAGLKRIY